MVRSFHGWKLYDKKIWSTHMPEVILFLFQTNFTKIDSVLVSNWKLCLHFAKMQLATLPE